jgi:peptidoglycan-associated lipoprotein
MTSIENERRHPVALRSLALALALLSIVLAGCAKRPALSQAAAPAPTGAATPTPPPAAPPAQLAPATPPPAAIAPPAPAPAPAPSPAPRPEPAEFRTNAALADVYFDFDKYAIKPDAAKTLDASIAWLKSNPAALVMIEGHCDERGTNAYNMALGERRAHAAQDYLVARGISAQRITTISYGEERPVCSEQNEACWSKNRRGHFLTKQP